MTQPKIDTTNSRAIAPERYDVITMAFHWLTLLFVLVLLGTSLVWTYWTPRDRVWRPLMESTHVSFGILLAALIVLRIVWRFTGGRKFLPEPGVSGVLSRLMYAALYLLLVASAVEGFVLRWIQGEDFRFFGLFTMPALLAPNRALERPLDDLHNWIGWAIIVLSAGHATMALIHRYVLKDHILQRMLYWRRAKAPEIIAG